MVRPCGGLPQVRVIGHASCHRDCCCRGEPRRMLVLFVRFLQIGAAAGKGRAGIDPAGGRCDDLDRTGLQNPLLDRRARARRRFLRDVCDGTIPARNGPGAGDPQSRRFHLAAYDHHRPQPGIRRTPAGCATTEGTQADAPEEAEAGPGCRSAGTGRCRSRAARHALNLPHLNSVSFRIVGALEGA